jgi:hypothetical protein
MVRLSTDVRFGSLNDKTAGEGTIPRLVTSEVVRTSFGKRKGCYVSRH